MEEMVRNSRLSSRISLTVILPSFFFWPQSDTFAGTSPSANLYPQAVADIQKLTFAPTGFNDAMYFECWRTGPLLEAERQLDAAYESADTALDLLDRSGVAIDLQTQPAFVRFNDLSNAIGQEMSRVKVEHRSFLSTTVMIGSVPTKRAFYVDALLNKTGSYQLRLYAKAAKLLGEGVAKSLVSDLMAASQGVTVSGGSAEPARLFLLPSPNKTGEESRGIRRISNLEKPILAWRIPPVSSQASERADAMQDARNEEFYEAALIDYVLGGWALWRWEHYRSLRLRGLARGLLVQAIIAAHEEHKISLQSSEPIRAQLIRLNEEGDAAARRTASAFAMSIRERAVERQRNSVK